MIQHDAPRVYADFNNADASGRVRLNARGTREDLARHHVELREGITLTLYDADADAGGQAQQLLLRGVVEYSVGEAVWVATVDWDSMRREPLPTAGRTTFDEAAAPVPPTPTGAPAAPPARPITPR